LHGILLIGLIGRVLVQAGGRGGGGKSRDRAAFAALGMGLMVTGFTGTVFANLIKASVSRQREFLADAAAVQFTRNPQGIAGALKRIGAASVHGLLSHPRAPEMSHAYFATGVRTFLGRLSATHPPLERRIRRLDPRWDGRFEAAAPTPGEPATGTDWAATSPVAASPAVALDVTLERVQEAIDQIGQPEEIHLRHAQTLIRELPATLRWAAREPYGAQALVFALLLDGDEGIRQRQLAHLETHLKSGLGAETLRLWPSVLATAREFRLPLVDLSLPALRQLSAPQAETFRAALTTLIAADGRVRLFEWCLSRILIAGLDGGRDTGRRRSGAKSQVDCQHLAADCALILTLVARLQEDAAASDQAFRLGIARLGLPESAIMETATLDHQRLDATLRQLRQLKPQAKRDLLQACAAVILLDARVSPAELEVLRAIGAVLDCPIPPLVIQTSSPA
ncbi:MAG: M48 family metalloprotease, partial [Chromatiaceae bacterium]|nr:M48 family metalloprotease [Candidatus Thioaporhodococcus sediminis]